MRWVFVILVLGFVGAPARGQELEIDLSQVQELVDGAQEWAEGNLDESVLKALGEVDGEAVRGFLVELEKRLQGNSIYELAALGPEARKWVPFLEQWEETLPVAEWLKTRLDYLEVAEELKRGAVEAGKGGGSPAPATATNRIDRSNETNMTKGTATSAQKRSGEANVKPPEGGTPNLGREPSLPAQRSIWKRLFERRAKSSTADAYVPRLKEIFTAERTPTELVWVAEVESSFNPKARSPVGAAGLFQLMKPTAKSLGLSTSLPDERVDPEKNGRAAARYLRQLHGRFGDWPLALAAYNAGESRVAGLLKKAGARDFGAIANQLPAETQLYVPKCEAAILKREGRSLAELKAPAG